MHNVRIDQLLKTTQKSRRGRFAATQLRVVGGGDAWFQPQTKIQEKKERKKETPCSRISVEFADELAQRVQARPTLQEKQLDNGCRVLVKRARHKAQELRNTVALQNGGKINVEMQRAQAPGALSQRDGVHEAMLHQHNDALAYLAAAWLRSETRI